MMPSQALFVDLPNFYSSLLRSGIEDARCLRDYFLYWLDFDRLAKKLTGEFSTIWIFYSGRRFGPPANRIEDEHLDKYVARINSLRGVTARDVNIPGKQREPATYQCEECKHEGVAQWESEKGIDASLTVHLFDTMDSWDSAYLLSGDADFVPAVASLRRRGKVVVGAGFLDTSSALVRECYDYMNLCDLFLKEDVAAYKIFKADGIIERWLTDEVGSRSDISDPSRSVDLTFEWQARNDATRRVYETLSINEIPNEGPHYLIYLIAKGPIDLSSRHQQIEDFATKFPNHVVEKKSESREYQLIVSPLAWNGVLRRLEAFTSSLKGSQVYEGRVSGNGYTMKYGYDSGTDKYELVVN